MIHWPQLCIARLCSRKTMKQKCYHLLNFRSCSLSMVARSFFLPESASLIGMFLGLKLLRSRLLTSAAQNVSLDSRFDRFLLGAMASFGRSVWALGLGSSKITKGCR